MMEDLSQNYVVPHEDIKEYRYAVYFEGIGLWKEKDPVRRANMAKRLAELTAELARKEEEEARQHIEHETSKGVA